jgi:ubiquinone/menaquinone biosynthesis C-methylase UbiE
MNATSYFKALSDETRLRLLNLAVHHELNVNELVRILGMGQSRISHHLKILTDSGLLTFRRDGLWAFYSAVPNSDGALFIQAIRYLFEKDPRFKKDVKEAETCIRERSSKTSRFFENQAKNWERLKQEITGDLDLNRKIIGALPRVKTIVDLGCGTGDLLPSLRGKAELVIGVEKSPPMLEEARKHYEKDGDRIDIRIGELEHLPLRDEEADAALVNMVLHHLPDPRRAFEEAFRVLRKEGRFFIIDFLSHRDESMRQRFGDVWLGFPQDTLEKWLSASGFSILSIDRFDLKKGLKGFLLESRKTSKKGE